MAVKMAVVKNLVTVKGLQVALNSGEGSSEGLPRSGNTAVYPLHYTDNADRHAQLPKTFLGSQME
jgi:hypothetical protein